MKKRLLAALVSGAMLISALAGCGSSGAQTSGDDSAGQTANQDYHIKVILKTLASEYWQYVGNGCKQAGEDLGVTVDVLGASSETAYDEQLSMIETTLSSSDCDAMVVAPLQAETVATQIAGTDLPIVAIDTNFDAPEVVSYVGTGNEAAAKKGAIAAVEAAKKAGWDEVKCIEIAGVQGDETCAARMKGYEEGVNEAGGEFLTSEVQYADATADRATTAMEAIMQTHPEGIAIICAHNDDTAMAAARAAKGHEAFKNTIFLGFNGDRAACEAILNGQMTMSVAQMAYEMGYKAVETMVQALDGETVDEFVDSGSDVVTPDNAQERLDTLKTQLH